MATWRPITKDSEIRCLPVGRKHRLDQSLNDGGCGLHIRLRQSSPSRGAGVHGYYTIRHALGGSPQEVGLDAGTWPTVPVAKARALAWKIADRLKADLRAGKDPIAERRQERADARKGRQEAREAERKAIVARRSGTQPKSDGTTLKDIGDAYYETRYRKWRKNTDIAFKTRQNLHINPILGELDPLTIATADVLRLLQKPAGKSGAPFWIVHPKQASFVRMHLETLLDFAYSQKEVMKRNPARWEGHMETLLGGNDDEDSEANVPIPIRRFPEFIQWLRTIDGTVARCLEFLALTAARSHMVLNATRHQIDRDNRVWIVRGGVMKGKKDHHCPLQPEVLKLLDELPSSTTGLLFPSIKGRVMAARFMRDLLHKFDPDATLHGLRSDFAIFCQKTDVPTETREIQLAHVHAGKVARRYAQDMVLGERRKLMARYADFAAGRFILPPDGDTAELALAA